MNYRSRGYTGPRCQRDEEDPLAGEIMLSEEVVKEESSAVERLVSDVCEYSYTVEGEAIKFMGLCDSLM